MIVFLLSFFSAMASEAKKVTLRSKDGVLFTVDEAVAMQSGTLHNLIQDDCAAEAIPIPNVDAKSLAKILDYAAKHAAAPPPPDGDAGLKAWDAEFVSKLDMDELYDMILGSNYLNVKGLLDLCVQAVADIVKGKTVEQLRETFNIKNDFTPEEEEEIRKQNAWAFE